MKSSTGGDGGLLATGVALIDLSGCVEAGFFVFAFGASKPVGPAHLHQVLPAGLFSRKTALKVDQTEIMVWLFLCVHGHLAS
jgi:hypothetical protein